MAKVDFYSDIRKLQKRDAGEAERKLRQKLQYDGYKEARAVSELVALLRRAGKQTTASDITNDALAAIPNDKRFLSARAWLHMDNGEYATAEQYFQKTISVSPDAYYTYAIGGAAEAAAHQEKFSDADKYFGGYGREDHLEVARGVVARLKGDLPKSRVILTKLTLNNDHFVRGFEELGATCIAIGRNGDMFGWADAALAFTRALDIYPTNVRARAGRDIAIGKGTLGWTAP